MRYKKWNGKQCGRSMSALRFGAAVLFALMVLCGLLLVGGQIRARAAAFSDYEVEVVVGYHNYVKYGSFAPVTVKLSGELAREGGTVEIQVSYGQGKSSFYRKTFSGAEETEVSFCVAIPESYESDSHMNFRVLDSQGNKCYETPVGYYGSERGQQIFVGVLTDQYAGMDYWNSLYIEEPCVLQGQSIPLSQEDVPQESQMLDMLDLILIKDFSAESLSQAQKKALSQWIWNGGVVLVDGSEMGLRIGEQIQKYEYYSGKILVGTGREEVCWNVDYGDGKVIWTEFDTDELSGVIQGQGDSLSQGEDQELLMVDIMGRERLMKIAENGYREMTAIYGLAAETVIAERDKTPQIWLYILILAVYICIVVPGCYFLLKKRDKLGLLRPFIVLLALIGSGLIFLAGNGTRFSDPFLCCLEVEEYQEGEMRQTIYGTVRAPYTSSYSLALDGSYEFLPIESSYVIGGVEYGTEEIQYGEDAYQIQYSDTPAFQKQVFRLRKQGKADAPVETNLSLFSGETTGSVKNQLDTVLEDAVLLTPEYALLLGDIEAGGETDASTADFLEYDSGMLEDMWEMVVPARLSSKVNRTRLEQIQNYMYSCYRRQPCVIGFISEPDLDIQPDARYEQYGEKMVVVYVELEMVRDGWEYTPFISLASRVVAGTFSGSENQFLEDTDGIMAYYINSGDEIKELEFHINGENGRETQVAEIYLLNPVTGAYTLFYPGKTKLADEELQNFIFSDMLYIRYRSAAQNGESCRLPRISMIWRENNAGN